MGLLSNWVERPEIRPGGRIYTWRAIYAYAHYGLFCAINFSTRKHQFGKMFSIRVSANSARDALSTLQPPSSPPLAASVSLNSNL
jgi:hypothetical protein